MGLCSFSHRRLIIHFHSHSGLSHVTLFGQQACHVLTYLGLSSCTSAIFVKITHLVWHAVPRKTRNTEAYLDSTTPHPWGPPWPRKPILCPPTHKKDRINCCWFKSLNFGTVYYATVVDQYHYPVLWLWGEKWSEVKWLSRVWLFATPWTVACRAALSMGFSRQEYWSGLPFPPPGIFPTQGSNWGLPHCRQMLYPEPPGKHVQPDYEEKKYTANFRVYLYTVLIVWWNMQSGKPQKTLKLWTLLWKILVKGMTFILFIILVSFIESSSVPSTVLQLERTKINKLETWPRWSLPGGDRLANRAVFYKITHSRWIWIVHSTVVWSPAIKGMR